MRLLTLGMSGDDVAKWQRFLVREQLLSLTAAPNAFFSSDVAAATKAFQRSSSLEQTGKADVPTLTVALSRGLLDPELAGPAAPTLPADDRGRRDSTALVTLILSAAFTLITSIMVEWRKSEASLDAEKEKLRSQLILRAIEVSVPNNPLTWSRGEAQYEVLNRLNAYSRLKLVHFDDGVLDDYLKHIQTVPVLTARSGAEGPSVVSVRPSAPPSIPPAAPPSTRTQNVFIQFAGFERQTIIALAQTLSSQWRVQGASGGGERVGAAAGKHEIRYGDEQDRTAAEQLAAAVARTGVIGRELEVKPNPEIQRGNLEVWIGR